MSDRMDKRSAQTDRPRVFKSHQVAGVGVVFPALEQVTGGDLPPSLSADFSAAGTFASPPKQVKLVLEVAREAEERARALERRAASLLEEVEETSLARLNEVEDRIAHLLAQTTAAVEQAEAEARATGYAAGYEEGHQSGMAAARAEAEEALQRARREAESATREAEKEAAASRRDMLQERSRLLEAARDQLLDLAFAVARQVLKAEVVLRPEAVLPMLEAALVKLKGEENPQVRVAPAVHAVLEEHRGYLLAAVPGARRITLESDSSMGPGDFVIQGSSGVVDGRLSQQMKLLEDATREER